VLRLKNHYFTSAGPPPQGPHVLFLAAAAERGSLWGRWDVFGVVYKGEAGGVTLR